MKSESHTKTGNSAESQSSLLEVVAHLRRSTWFFWPAALIIVAMRFDRVSKSHLETELLLVRQSSLASSIFAILLPITPILLGVIAIYLLRFRWKSIVGMPENLSKGLFQFLLVAAIMYSPYKFLGSIVGIWLIDFLIAKFIRKNSTSKFSHDLAITVISMLCFFVLALDDRMWIPMEDLNVAGSHEIGYVVSESPIYIDFIDETSRLPKKISVSKVLSREFCETGNQYAETLFAHFFEKPKIMPNHCRR